MLDAGSSNAAQADQETVQIYQSLKDLVWNNQTREARTYLRDIDLQNRWEALLHYAMIRRNCPVVKIILISVINNGILNPDEIRLRVSKVDHCIQLDFAKRVQEYAKSAEFSAAFDPEFRKYSNVRETVVSQLVTSLGSGFLNPNQF